MPGDKLSSLNWMGVPVVLTRFRSSTATFVLRKNCFIKDNVSIGRPTHLANFKIPFFTLKARKSRKIQTLGPS